MVEMREEDLAELYEDLSRAQAEVGRLRAGLRDPYCAICGRSLECAACADVFAGACEGMEKD